MIAGPANAGKVELLLDRYLAALEAGQEPVLVVPNRADVDRVEGELLAPRSWPGDGGFAAVASRPGAGALLGGVIAFLGAWILFKTQLDILEGMVRAITDILWTGSRQVRAWRGGDVRAVYYSVLAAVVLWGIAALRFAQPIVLLKLGANVAAVVFIVASLHLLYVNTRLLPQHVRPPMWRRAALIGMALFYGFFVTLSLRSFGSSS